MRGSRCNPYHQGSARWAIDRGEARRSVAWQRGAAWLGSAARRAGQRGAQHRTPAFGHVLEDLQTVRRAALQRAAAALGVARALLRARPAAFDHGKIIGLAWEGDLARATGVVQEVCRLVGRAAARGTDDPIGTYVDVDTRAHVDDRWRHLPVDLVHPLHRHRLTTQGEVRAAEAAMGGGDLA